MGKRDTLSLCERYIKILIYLQQNPKCDIQTIATHLNLSYVWTNQLLNKFSDSGYIDIHQKETMMLGGEKLELSITKKGISFLEGMLLELKNVFKKISD